MAKVLIAEDDPVTSRMILAVVEGLGHHAFRCSNGRRALEALVDNPDFGLLITDVGMPEMSGTELAQILRGQDCYPCLPILVCSGVLELSSVRPLLELGVSRCLAKPLDYDDLRAAVEALLAGRGAAARRAQRRPRAP